MAGFTHPVQNPRSSVGFIFVLISQIVGMRFDIDTVIVHVASDFILEGVRENRRHFAVKTTVDGITA